MLLPLLLVPILALLYWTFAPVQPKCEPPRSIIIKKTKNGDIRRNAECKELISTPPHLPHIETIPEFLNAIIEKYGPSPALGQRRIVSVDEKQVIQKIDGKEITKVHKIPRLTDYEWQTYDEFGQKFRAFGNALLLETEIKPAKRSSPKPELATELADEATKMMIFAGTRAEWQVGCQACLCNGVVVVTAYPSLGADALGFSIEQTQITHLLTEAKMLDIVFASLKNLKHSLKYVIYMDELPQEKLKQYQEKFPAIKIFTFQSMIDRGINLSKDDQKKIRSNPAKISRDTVACIMYTSGSTGNPKGVMMSHGNLIATMSGIMTAVEPFGQLCENDTYIAYLPLAHILELLAETTLLCAGAKVGYSSPLTLKDDGAIDAKTGKPKGDLSALQPTLMAAVPLILDRLKTGIMTQVNKASPMRRVLFYTAYYLKRRNWLRGMKSPILDKIVFDKVKARLGGRLRFLLSGGAPLGKEAQEFMAVCLGAPVLQAYGLTETLGGGAITHPHSVQCNRVGPPLPSCEIKLVPVEEMGYTAETKSGEIWIRGRNVSLGYYKMPEKTAEDYMIEDDEPDLRWFKSGDIGRWNDTDETLSVIDRKKDLQKLSHGEYIALGNLESKYIHSNLLDNICVCASSHHQRPVAVCVPNHNDLIKLAQSLNLQNEDLHQLCNDDRIKQAILDDLNKIATSVKFEKWERIAAVHLCADEWTPQSGLLTEAMKLKRHEVNKRFAKQIEDLYKQADT